MVSGVCRDGGFPKLLSLVSGPYKKDYNVLGLYLGSPCLQKLPYELYSKLLKGGYYRGWL